MSYCGPTSYRPPAEWVSTSGGDVPDNAVHGGYDIADEIYVGRASQSGDIIPGKVVPSHGCCYVPHGGDEKRCCNYQVLTNPYGSCLEWVHASGGDIPAGALQGGNTSDGEPLYIGRHEHEGTMTVGKVHPTHGVLYIAFGGAEHPYSDYEVLVCKTLCL